VQAAVDCGFDAAQVRADLDSDKDVEAVTREAQSAKEAGIEGVPCYIFGGMLAVSGAQAPDYLADAIQRVADEQSKQAAE
jgi:predicted DsbA family dithiol-disulfide isomerase